MKEPLFLKPVSEGPFNNDDLMLIGEPFYEPLVGMGSKPLFNSFLEGLQIDWCDRMHRRGGY